MQFYKTANDIACNPHPLLVKRKRRDCVRPTVNAHGFGGRSDTGTAKGSGLRYALSHGEAIRKGFYAPSALSLAAHIALRETNQGLWLTEVNYERRKTSTAEDFRSTNLKRSVPVLLLNAGYTHLGRKLAFIELNFDDNLILQGSKFSAVKVRFVTLRSWLPVQVFSPENSPYLEQLLHWAGNIASAMVVLRAEGFNKQRKHSPPGSGQHHPITPSNNTPLA
ncbi:MAG: hypothetical protein KTR35_13390 [Gammaproteobacteria bacterium]|nr:hypothetical protein [Gammaproteobacteria bacterium]